MRQIQFANQAIDDLKKFKTVDHKLAFKIFEIITDIQNDPFRGLGKPEPLKGNYSGFWSRRINEFHRLIYSVTDDLIIVYSCFGHY